MELKSIVVMHYDRDYFGNEGCFRVDEMPYPSSDKISRAIDKMVRRHRKGIEGDALYVTYSDGTGYRLTYEPDGDDMVLKLRHYTSMERNRWGVDMKTSPSNAKRTIGMWY